METCVCCEAIGMQFKHQIIPTCARVRSWLPLEKQKKYLIPSFENQEWGRERLFFVYTEISLLNMNERVLLPSHSWVSHIFFAFSLR